MTLLETFLLFVITASFFVIPSIFVFSLNKYKERKGRKERLKSSLHFFPGDFVETDDGKWHEVIKANKFEVYIYQNENIEGIACTCVERFTLNDSYCYNIRKHKPGDLFVNSKGEEFLLFSINRDDGSYIFGKKEDKKPLGVASFNFDYFLDASSYEIERLKYRKLRKEK